MPERTFAQRMPEGRLAGASRKPNFVRSVLLGFAALNPTYESTCKNILVRAQ
jgi:hypothetical protein